MPSFLTRFGLALVAVSMVLLLALTLDWIQDDRLAVGIKYGLAAGAGLIVLGFALASMGKVGGAVRRSRCARCRRPVRKGAIYCPDHLKEALQEARDKYHQDHGSGI